MLFLTHVLSTNGILVKINAYIEQFLLLVQTLQLNNTLHCVKITKVKF